VVDVTLELHGHKDHFAIRTLRHLLQRLQLPNLHSSRRSQDIRSLPHQPSRVYLCPSRDDLCFSNSLLLSSGGQGGGDFLAKDDVFDENAFDVDTPFVGHVPYDFGNFESNGFTFGDDTLNCAGSDNLTQGGLGTLN